jgi:hypothetical protein
VLYDGYGPPTGTVSGTNSRRNAVPGDYYYDRDTGDVYKMSPDVVVNYCVWDPDNSDMDEYFFVSGGLNAVKYGNGVGSIKGSVGVSSGKWYWELDPAAAYGYGWHIGIGSDSTGFDGVDFYYETDGKSYFGINGNKYDDGDSTAFGDTFTGTNIISVALDMDNGKIWWAKDGVWQASGDPANGTNEAFSGITGTIYPMANEYFGSAQLRANFGQSAFSHSVPAGFNSGLYQASDEGIWSVVTSVSGSLQEAIDRIPVWHDGAGTPSGTLGAYKDYYLDRDDGDIFKKERYVTHSCTWNPDDKDAGIDLSNGNLTCSSNDLFTNSVRATDGVSSGKWYWEITYTQEDLVGTSYLGIANGSAAMSQLCGWNANSWGYSETDGKIYFNSSGYDYGDTYSTDDVIGIALDMDSGKVWFAKNGVWQGGGDPETGAGEAFSGLTGTMYPCAAPHRTDDVFTANFGATGFAYPAPAGFDTLTSWFSGWFRKWNPDGRYHTKEYINNTISTLSGTVHLWDRVGTALTPRTDGDDIDYKYGDIKGSGNVIAGGYSNANDSILTVQGDIGLRKLNSIPTTDSDFWKLYVREYGTSVPVVLDEWQIAHLEVSNASSGYSCCFNDPYYVVVGGYTVNLSNTWVRVWYTTALNGNWQYNDVYSSGRCYPTAIGHDGSNYFICSRVIPNDGNPFVYQAKVFYSDTLDGTWNSSTIYNSDLASFTPYGMIYDSDNGLYVVAGTYAGVEAVYCYYSSTLSGTWGSTRVDSGGGNFGSGRDLLYDGTNYVICGGQNFDRQGYKSSCDIWYSTSVSGSWSTKQIEYDGINDIRGTSIAYNGSNQYVIVGEGANPYGPVKVWYSSSLSEGWVDKEIASGGHGYSIIHDGASYIVVGDSGGGNDSYPKAWFTSDPSGSWSSVLMDSLYSDGNAYCICYDDDHTFFASGCCTSDEISSAKVFYSTTMSGSWSCGKESSVFALDDLGNEYDLVTGSGIDHGNLSGLTDDDHPQYHTDARGDARYYTETELDNGQLDNRYYTESEVDDLITTVSGAIDRSLESKEMTIFEPDQVNTQVPMFHVNDRIYPNGVDVIAVSIQLSEGTSYTMGFEEWSGDPLSFSSTIEDVSTTASGSYAEVETTDIDDSTIASGNWVFLDIPSTDVDWVVSTCVFRKKHS